VIEYAKEHFNDLPRNTVSSKDVVIAIVDEKEHGVIIESILKTAVAHLGIDQQVKVKLEVINQVQYMLIRY